MATQIVMDHTGDSRHQFDPKDSEAVARAEGRFRALIAAGFIAAEPGAFLTPERCAEVLEV